MTLGYNSIDKYFYFACHFEEKDVPKNAGFKWDPKVRVWWTKDVLNAQKLIQYALDRSVTDCIYSLMRRREENILASRAVSSDIEVPCPEGLTYMPFQKAGISYSLKRKSTLIADEMGLGKTIQAIGVMNAMNFPRTLIICPATIKLNWKRELEKWLAYPKMISVIGGPEEDVGADIVIINFDRIKRFIDVLIKGPWNAVIVDEAHGLKNQKTQRSKYVELILAGTKPEKTLFLTGTPIVNRPIELFNLLKLLNVPLARNFWDFAKKYCNASRNRYGWDFSGASNLEELQSALRASVLVRRIKREVLTELPEKRRQIIELSSEGYEDLLQTEDTYHDRFSQLIGELPINESEEANEYETRVKQLHDNNSWDFVEISRIRHQTALAKTKDVVSHVKEVLESENKVVVFAHHRDVLDAIAFGLMEYNPLILSGSTPNEERQRLIDQFQENPDVRVFVGSIQAAGLGVTLTAASVAIFAELDWVPGNIMQAEDRLHRIGQKDSVLIQHLVIDGSIDAKLAKVIVEKQNIIDKALDKTKVVSKEK